MQTSSDSQFKFKYTSNINNVIQILPRVYILINPEIVIKFKVQLVNSSRVTNNNTVYRENFAPVLSPPYRPLT